MDLKSCCGIFTLPLCQESFVAVVVECKHIVHMKALQGFHSSTVPSHLRSSSRHTLFQLNINELQEALSC